VAICYDRKMAGMLSGARSAGLNRALGLGAVAIDSTPDPFVAGRIRFLVEEVGIAPAFAERLPPEGVDGARP
jgi:hypothetical protein